MENNSDTQDRELIVTRTFNAPIDLVWEAWSKPEHICNWWGPDGFTCTISKMDFRTAGEWRLVLHSPDGTDFNNESIFREVIPFKKIIYEHISYPHIVATITFEARGDKTYLHWHMLFASHEDFVKVVKTYGADKGQKENVVKLSAYLENMKS